MKIKNKDLRDKYTEKTSKGTETQGFFYEEYVLWLEEQILALRTYDVVDVSNSVFSITEEQLNKLIEKVQNNIKTKLNKKGEYSLSSDLSQSVSDTIKFYLKKHCC